jgi:hypothetical protein
MLQIKGIAISYSVYAIWVSCPQRPLSYLALIESDEGFHRNGICALNLISNLILSCNHIVESLYIISVLFWIMIMLGEEVTKDIYFNYCKLRK